MLDCPLEVSFILVRPYASRVLVFPCFFFSKYLIFGHMACGILVPWPGIESSSPALEAGCLNHWTTGKSPALVSLLVACSYSLENFKSSLYLVLWHCTCWVRCRSFLLTCSALSLLFFTWESHTSLYLWKSCSVIFCKYHHDSPSCSC